MSAGAKIDLQVCDFLSFELGYGITQFIARSTQTNAPIGTIWIQASAIGVAEIVDCYTPWWCRRQGVMRWMFDKLREKYPVLRTDHGTDDGEPFLKSYGFKQDAHLGWIYKPQRAVAKAKRICRSSPYKT